MLNNISLQDFDHEIYEYIQKEKNRQKYSIELIASENFVSSQVLEAQGSVLTNKYAEGYPNKRYYGGCEFVDHIESIAIERIKTLFGAKYANVQPHSGSQANQAAFLALLSPGDTILSLSLDSGGHLTHGSKVNLSGKWFNIEHYFVDPNTYLINYDKLLQQAKTVRPKLIICGASAYPRKIDFKKFREIADSVGAYLMADIAHIAGIIAAGRHQNPIEYADVVTSTTHKTLRGPRGGIILSGNLEIGKKINSAIFPGLQGGPLMHVIAAKAVAFKEALSEDFKVYIDNVLVNARSLANTLMKNGHKILTDGTDTHLMLVDLRGTNISGKDAQILLDSVGLACNKNSIPYDTEKPTITSGIRLGTPAATTRGFGEKEFVEVGELICKTLANPTDSNVLNIVSNRVRELCEAFPI